MVHSGVVWCSAVPVMLVVWCHVVKYGAVWGCVVQCNAVWYSIVQCGAVWASVVHCGAVLKSATTRAIDTSQVHHGGYPV